jgi:hypothetical protein
VLGGSREHFQAKHNLEKKKHSSQAFEGIKSLGREV